MGLGGIGGLGGDFHMPDWIQNLTGSGGAALAQEHHDAAPSVLTAPPPPAANAGTGPLTIWQNAFSKLGGIMQSVDGTSSAGSIGWLKKAGQGAARDVTDRFKQLNAAATTGQNTLPPDAKSYVYLNVGGLYTDHYPGYFDDNIGREKALGLDARRVPVVTDHSVAQNAAVIRQSILDASKDGKQVVLIGHSKGGVDVTAALSLYPELKSHVRAVVAMQTPYAGSPIATDVETCGKMKFLMDAVVKLGFSGNPASLADLSYPVRQAFVKAHPYPQDIPTVSLATSAPTGTSLVAATRDYVMGRYGAKADGLVVQQDAEIPGSSVVRLDDMDHAASAMGGPHCLCKYKPADVTEALITLALTTPAGKPS